MQEFFSKVIAHGLSLAFSRQISKRVGKALDKAWEAGEKTIRERKDEINGMRRLQTGRVISTQKMKESTSDEMWEKKAKACRAEIIPFLIDMGFDDDLAERAVESVLYEVEHHDRTESLNYIMTQAHRRAKTLRRNASAMARASKIDAAAAAMDAAERALDAAERDGELGDEE